MMLDFPPVLLYNYTLMKKKSNGKRGIGYLLSLLWLLSMALAGYFFPYFTDNIPFFKVKALHVEGLESIPPQVVLEEVKNLKNNWLFINKSTLLKNLNKKTNNAVEDIEIERVFSKSGVELKINIKERKPLFSVIKDNTKVFFDEDGNIFQSPYINTVDPLVYSQDLNVIAQNFSNIKKLIMLMQKDIREVYVTELNTIIYLKNGTKLVLPPLFLLDEKVLYYIKKVKIYNIDMWAKEIEIGNKQLLIIR
ncbi:MAG: cell division protein FtsQ/DivIB [Aquificaceae bacterium]